MGKKQRRKAAQRAARSAAPDDRTNRTNRSVPRQRGRRRRNPWPWVVGIGGVIMLAAINLTVNAVREANLPGERFRSQGNVHVSLGTETPAYNSDPPTSGWHTPGLAAWGAYTADPPHDQELVHNMEDGGVILWYRAGTLEENEAHVLALQEVLGNRWPRTVIVPREGMPTTYALTAWTRLQRFDAVDPDGKRAFLEAYHGTDHHPGF
jgi:hypothetical protein